MIYVPCSPVSHGDSNLRGSSYIPAHHQIASYLSGRPLQKHKSFCLYNLQHHSSSFPLTSYLDAKFNNMNQRKDPPSQDKEGTRQ